MKRLTILGVDGSKIAEAESEHGGGVEHEIDVPPNLNLVGVYGHIGGDPSVKAIWGLGLLFFQKEAAPEDPMVAALREKIM